VIAIVPFSILAIHPFAEFAIASRIALRIACNDEAADGLSY
jgi:hypothetical protein